jgi:hypothetical protein
VCTDAPPRETALPAPNRIFVDREQPKGLFERVAFSVPADRAIIRVFYHYCVINCGACVWPIDCSMDIERGDV